MRFFSIFALVALVEMATFFWVQSWIGLGWALGLALLTAIVGSVLVKRAGVAVFRRFRERVDNAQVPGRELSDGASVLVAGAFLISPGFITDILGFSLLIPAVQGWIYRKYLPASLVSLPICEVRFDRHRGHLEEPTSKVR